jgi:hypothetical protein
MGKHWCPLITNITATSVAMVANNKMRFMLPNSFVVWG